MNKEDRLCEYIEHLINSIYCGKALNEECKDCYETYNKLIDGLKKIGFKFDFAQSVKFNEINV